MSNARLIGDLCPLCYRSTAGGAHRRMFDGDLIVCDDQLLPFEFPRDVDTQEPLLMQAPYVDDPYLFGVACVHLMRCSRLTAGPAFERFRRRWPVGAALVDMERNPIAALLDHYRCIGLHEQRARLTWRIIDRGICAYTAYPCEALRVLAELDLEHPATDIKVEAWRRWRLWQMGVES